MEIKRWILFYVILLSGYVAVAQDYSFQVLINKGSNKVKSGNTWQPVKTGVALKAGDELKLSNNSYIGLRHVSGKLVQVKQQGVYQVADLAANLTGSIGLLKKCATYMFSENIKVRRLMAVGGVTRGGKDSLELYLPSSRFTGIFGKEIIINWESKGQQLYVVELQNMFQDVVASYETTETSLLIDMTDAKLSDKDLSSILIKVAAKNNSKITSSYKFLKILSEEEKMEVKKALAEISTNFNEENAINKLALAGFYEEMDLVVDAITAYQQAIGLAPDVADFKLLYEDFLFRNGLKVPKE